MTKRKGQTRPYEIDRDWPHQIALQDDLCVMENFTRINGYLAGLNISCRSQTVQARWPDGHCEPYRVFCFRDAADAAAFRLRFGGMPFDPATHRRGKRRDVWLREGPYERYLASGPLRVPPLLVT